MKMIFILVLVAVAVAMVWRLAAAPGNPKDPREPGTMGDHDGDGS